MLYIKIFKPLLDFLLALVLLFIFSPILIFLSMLIYIKMGRPIFFTQKRPGYHENIFQIYKFRTMNFASDNNGVLLSDEKRLQGLGKYIRAFSLDELPQLFNVLKGDMSFIGPRPLLVEYLPLYNQEQKKRHNVKPGITGWAQINGRNAISWEEKFNFDIWYVKHISFFLDFKIIALTLMKVLRKEDISSQNHATMEAFRGTDANQ